MVKAYTIEGVEAKNADGYYFAKVKKLAQQGKLDAIRCAIGKSVRWYYCEKQAELAHLRGEV